MKLSLLLGSFALAISAATASAVTYNGNGAGGFGGTLGSGSVSITSDPTGMITFTLNPSGGSFSSNNVVLYIDSKAGGIATNTSTLSDDADPTRDAISGYLTTNGNAGNVSTRTLVNFPTGFAPDYAVSFDSQPGSTLLYGLVAGGANSLSYVTQNPASNTGVFSLTVPAAGVGVTKLGGSFTFIATLIADSTYRSNETIGASTTTVDPGNAGAAPNAGYNGTVTFSAIGGTFAIPEPGAYACMGLGAIALLGLSRFRARRA